MVKLNNILREIMKSGTINPYNNITPHYLRFGANVSEYYILVAE